MKYSVDVKQLDKLISQVEKDSETALMKCWLYLEWKIKEQIQLDSYDTWQLARSINTQKVWDNKIVVWTNLEYWLVREFGRRPWKFPPLQVLVPRTARKGMISWWATSRYDDLHYEDKWVIFVIARAIATRWIAWKHTFQNVVAKERQNIVNLYAKYLNEW